MCVSVDSGYSGVADRGHARAAVVAAFTVRIRRVSWAVMRCRMPQGIRQSGGENPWCGNDVRSRRGPRRPIGARIGSEGQSCWCRTSNDARAFPGHSHRSDAAGCASLVVNRNGLPQALRKRFLNVAYLNVTGTPCRIGNNDGDRPRRVGLLSD